MARPAAFLADRAGHAVRSSYFPAQNDGAILTISPSGFPQLPKQATVLGCHFASVEPAINIPVPVGRQAMRIWSS
jgi:hypothetical protein